MFSVVIIVSVAIPFVQGLMMMGQQRQGLFQPIDPSAWPDRFPAKEHCSKCGLCETSFVKDVTVACAFLKDGMSKMDELEVQVHGRRRDTSLLWNNATTTTTTANNIAEEARFGVMWEPMKLVKAINMPDAQWTGVVTTIAVCMLESDMVDAVVCIASDDDASATTADWSSPKPILARTKTDILRGRGVKPSLAPSLNVLDEIRHDKSIRRLLFCGVGCAVQAFRSVQSQLDLEEIYVLGTNCVDNSPTPEAADGFLREGFDLDPSLGRPLGYEFAQDFRVHVKTEAGYTTKPYFSLPKTIAAPSIATSCLACSDYTNSLADVVVGYMGAPFRGRMDKSPQTITIRNARGATMVESALNRGRLVMEGDATGTGQHQSLVSATVASDAIVQSILGEPVRDSGMPTWLGNILAWVLSTFVAPKGVNFARYSIDYHLLRNYLHMLDAWGEERARRSLPGFAKLILDHYKATDSKFANMVAKAKGSQK